MYFLKSSVSFPQIRIQTYIREEGMQITLEKISAESYLNVEGVNCLTLIHEYLNEVCVVFAKVGLAKTDGFQIVDDSTLVDFV